jgi:hypothetical protein
MTASSPQLLPSARRPLATAVVTTLAVTALSYLLPLDYAATGVGLAFLMATYFLALRDADAAKTRHFGLSLGGVLEPEPIEVRRVLRDAAGATAMAALLAALCFPPFWLGFVAWWQPGSSFAPRWSAGFADEALGQALVIALPEEAFYRGYLQTSFDDVWPKRTKVLGAELGLGVVVTSALFAIGHVLTDFHPNRLAVFFPSLVFGWLRAKSGGIGAAVVFHALCNLFAAFLARSYGL